MKEGGMVGKASSRFKPQTTDSDHSNRIAPNHLKQDFEVKERGSVLVGDITYIHTLQGWLYLATFMDLCNRKIVGWATSDSLKSELVEEALLKAIRNGKLKRRAIVHTDRGVQYTSDLYRRILAQNRLRASMSARGNCYDNAPAESFFHTLKVELFHGEPTPLHHQHAKRLLFEYIEGYYNSVRMHSALGNLSPAEYERLNPTA
jgi:transposase InsO family protein